MTHRLTRTEIAHWHAEWQRAYASGVFEQLGKWTVDGTDYSAFDHRFMSHFLQGGKAEVEYTGAPANALLLLFKEGRAEWGEYRELEGRPKPTVADLIELTGFGELRVFPPNLAWTAFFHHEYCVPTYFTYREWTGYSQSGNDEALSSAH